MAGDSRRIIPPRSGTAVNQAEQNAIPRSIIAAAIRMRTNQVRIEGASGNATVIAAASRPRRSATLFYPDTDPDGTVNTATVWIVGDPADADRPFPLVPGATLTVDLSGWLFGFCTTSDEPVVYVFELED